MEDRRWKNLMVDREEGKGRRWKGYSRQEIGLRLRGRKGKRRRGESIRQEEEGVGYRRSG